MKLESGAVVSIQPADIEDSWALLQAFAREGLSIQVLGGDEQAGVLKNIFCASLASSALHQALLKCALRCTYNSLKVEPATFQDVKSREDYLEVLYLVAEANLKPFTKSLYARFKGILEQLAALQNTPA